MKLNKKILSLVAISSLGFLSVIPSANALTSEANVNFTEPTTLPDIVDPDDPSTPLEPEPAPGGNVNTEPGSLTLDYVSHLEFGSHALSPRAQTYYAQNEKTPFAQVTDVRGTGAGWRLTASLSNFTDGTDDSLEGATITLLNDAGDIVTTPDNFNAAAPTLTNEITLNSSTNDTQLVTNALANTGKGTWVTRWQDNDTETDYNQSVALNVPAAVATEGAHTATITWELSNAPTGVTP